MSLKQIKKVLEAQKKQEEEDIEEEEEEEEEEEVGLAPAKKKKGKAKKAPTTTNAFAGLEVEEDDMLPQDEEETEKKATPKPAASKKKKNKGKAKANKPKEEKEDSEEDIDAILNSINGGAPSAAVERQEGPVNVVEQERLFKVDPKMLDPDAEIRRVFGAKALGSATRKEAAQHARKGGKKTYLVKPKDDWPPMLPGVSMEMIENKSTNKNVNYFKMAWSSTYNELQQHFYECVETADPYSFQDLLMIHPYHVDSTLQLSQVCIQTGDYAMAGDLIERCLYTFECAWHHRFAPHGPVNCYMEFNVPENRSFFLAILKHIQLLTRRGSLRTALEFAKLLISLDPADPLYMRGVLDYYCLRGKEPAFLISLFERAQVANTPFSFYPNFCYSAALAQFTLEQQKSSKSSSSETSTAPTATNDKTTNPYPLASSKYLLYNALTLFPSVVLPLMNKAGISYRDVIRLEAPNAFFTTNQDTLPPLLQKTITLFVDKNNTLWKAPEIITWLKEVITEVQKQVEKNGKELSDICNLRDKVTREWEEMSSRMGSVPLLLSEHAETAAPLPPELFQNQGPHQPPPPQPVPLAGNPLALFLQTLLPWVPIPPPPE